VWFFSLDASNLAAVWGARLAFALPYYHADIEMRAQENEIHFSNCRSRRHKTPPATFDGAWQVFGEPYEAAPGSLEHFLVERYCLYTRRRNRLYRARIDHRPWKLRNASPLHFSSTMIQAQGIDAPQSPALLHAQAEPLLVETWPTELI
jgi:uncharacterized protein YqjF (DUF2071 family)